MRSSEGMLWVASIRPSIAHADRLKQQQPKDSKNLCTPPPLKCNTTSANPKPKKGNLMKTLTLIIIATLAVLLLVLAAGGCGQKPDGGRPDGGTGAIFKDSETGEIKRQGEGGYYYCRSRLLNQQFVAQGENVTQQDCFDLVEAAEDEAKAEQPPPYVLADIITGQCEVPPPAQQEAAYNDWAECKKLHTKAAGDDWAECMSLAEAPIKEASAKCSRELVEAAEGEARE